MVPDDVFKRRRNHNNTPQSVLLIIANFIVVSLALTLFTDKTHINWFFWIVVALLAFYNFYTIRRYRDEFNKPTIIAYCISLATLIALFFVFRAKQ